MQKPEYYREQAELARRLTALTLRRELAELLNRVATDYDDIAEDLESGAISIRHPELLPQLEHPR